jgi:hypothetical protein
LEFKACLFSPSSGEDVSHSYLPKEDKIFNSSDEVGSSSIPRYIESNGGM